MEDTGETLFSLHDRVLDPAMLRGSLQQPECGGYVAFEGWVRDHNEGRRVLRLEYEAFETLALREGDRILREAQQRFGLQHVRCAHRIGALSIGDIAVWVGVSAAHRGECFDACRFIIDEIKHRLPIWKKEHYAGGDSDWVNCQQHAGAPAAAAPDPERSNPHSHRHG